MAINFLFVNILYIIVWYHYKGDLLAFHLSPQLNLFDKHRGHMTSLNHKLHTLSHNLRLNYIVYLSLWDQGISRTQKPTISILNGLLGFSKC